MVILYHLFFIMSISLLYIFNYFYRIILNNNIFVLFYIFYFILHVFVAKEREPGLIALLNRRGNPSPAGCIADDSYYIKRCPEGIDRILPRCKTHRQDDRIGWEDYLLMIAQPFQCHRMFLN